MACMWAAWTNYFRRGIETDSGIRGKRMSAHCDDCGCRKVSGYCTNCHEEAYIAFEQAPDMQFSEEFMQKAWDQESQRAGEPS